MVGEASEVSEGLAAIEAEVKEVAGAVGEVEGPRAGLVKVSREAGGVEVRGPLYSWDPVKGMVKLARQPLREVPEGEEGVALYGGDLTPLYKAVVWRDPSRAKCDDRKVRLMLTSTGALVTGVLNHWGKWLVAGYGVVDPVAYAEVSRPKPEDMPWRTK